MARTRPEPAENRVPTVKVRALKDNVKQHIVHKPTGYKFDKDGFSHWPHDQFTKRRIADGDIAIVKEQEQEQQPPQPAADEQQQAETRRTRRTSETPQQS